MAFLKNAEAEGVAGRGVVQQMERNTQEEDGPLAVDHTDIRRADIPVALVGLEVIDVPGVGPAVERAHEDHVVDRRGVEGQLRIDIGGVGAVGDHE